VPEVIRPAGSAIDWKKLKDEINSKIEKKISDERSGQIRGRMGIQENVKYYEKFKNAIIDEINAGREVSLDVVKMFLELKDKENQGAYPGYGGVGGGQHTRKQHGGAIPPPWSRGSRMHSL
jgi:hypothetical protein